MARGWESKSVEAQQEAATDSWRVSPPLSERDAAKRTRRDTLMLSRTRALSDLQRACAPAHRAMLEQAIADLDRQLALLDDNP
jgi:hypothetical protein